MKHKDSDFYDIPFDRSKLLGVFSLKNDFHISKSPEITLSLNGQVQTKAIQATTTCRRLAVWTRLCS